MRTTLLFTTSLFAGACLANPVPNLSLDTDSITVSGLSSGGYMANQFHVAYSSWVSGAGIVAAGPYYCGQNAITTALAQCVDKKSETLSLLPLKQQAQTWAQSGAIDSLENIKQSRVWLLRGTLDATINQQVADALHEQYSQWVDEKNLVYVNDKAFGHHFPTLDSGTACSVSQAPFLGNCQYDAAGELLNHLYSDLTQPDAEVTGKVIAFDQKERGGPEASGLADTAYMFVPTNCEQGEKCQIHVSFHGCNQYAEAVGKEYVTNTGLNRWADDNNMVVLYPQTKKSLFMPLNPQGCWDWWGYTGENYATKSGDQLVAVKNMIESLSKETRNEN